MKNLRFSRSRILCGAALGIMSLASTAYAQTEGEEVVTTTEEPAEDEARQEKITVTGSLLRRDEFSSASPIQVITAEIATLEGLVNSSQILQGSSVAAGSTQLNGQFTGFVVDGGTGVETVDLRGCGGTRSLILLNGKRPGPSGTRGAVGAFDFNVIPGSIVQRYDVLKDSGSTIYGSDAVCGVINVITRTQIDRPELTVNYSQPFESGGEQLTVSGAYGFDFMGGSIALAAEFYEAKELNVGDRSYLDCSEDLVYDPNTGVRLDRENRSVTAGADSRACSNIYFNTVIDNVTGQRLIPSPDGITGGTNLGGVIPGYRPRVNPNYSASGPAYYEDVLVDSRQAEVDAINGNQRVSLYGVADFDLDILGGVNWQTELLYNERETTADGIRQFFPQIRGLGTALPASITRYALSPTYANPLNSVFQPVTIWSSDAGVDLKYYYAGTSLSGDFKGLGLNDWAWELGANYAYSDGDYSRNQIVASRTGDWSQFGPNGSYAPRRDAQGNVILDRNGFAQVTPIAGSGAAPTYDVTSPEFLSGNGPAYDAAFNALNEWETGNTIYDQWLVQGSVAGPLFSLPAGEVQAGLGFEYRKFSIEDVPGDLTRGEVISVTDTVTGTAYQARVADIWGSSTAGITAGEDSVAEIFGEIEVPLLRGMPLVEDLSFNASGRAFEYDSFGQNEVYKLGMNWQMTPAVRLRGTLGTSYRAPALFELFLDSQTAFLGQTAIDPCASLANETNPLIIQNCNAIGITAAYTGLGSSATIISGGGAGNLDAETSESSTVGLIFTPTFAPFSVALDYYEIQIDDQIAQLGAATILQGCYAAENFPNEFCNLFIRAPSDSPGNANNILSVENSYLNVNQQTFRGIDLTARYEQDFNFGTILTEADASWALEREVQLFAPGTQTGFDNEDGNGTIGQPSMTANFRTVLSRGDFRYTWFMDYVGRSSNERFSSTPGARNTPYFGTLANRDYNLEAVTYHGLSVEYRGDNWRLIAGVRNLFDEAPPTVSTGGATRRGNTALVATQYDLRGRTGFLTISRQF
ncbi:TonB-dependent receptor [Hyphomonas sp.]|uniref:TonB-dependent receptor domain-containing protein n=1 Tax=Hyphomonas sp. TaxID=87 RepID=UPI001BCCE57F|nr:TonB-dependent receptor [Hyphomonas sp.]